MRLLGIDYGEKNIGVALSDDKGLVWPASVAPFAIHLIALGEVKKDADKIYNDLIAKGIEVLYDDRDARAGEKFADSDLIGIPKRIVVSEKTLANGEVEVKERRSEEVKMVKVGQISV